MFTLDQPAITNSTHHHTLLPKHIFYFEQLTEDVTRVFPPLDHARKSWTHPTTLMPWLTSETKIWNLPLTLRPPSLNRIRNTQNVILPDPKQDYLLHTTTHPSTNNKSIPNWKKTLLLLPSLNFNRRFTMSELKSKFTFSPPGKHSPTTGFELWFANY